LKTKRLKKGDIIKADIHGTGAFPLDMLRYDFCSMASETWAPWPHAPNAGPWTVRVKKVVFNPDSKAQWTPGRWASFGCVLEEVVE
jgi:hypothetical protein